MDVRRRSVKKNDKKKHFAASENCTSETHVNGVYNSIFSETL